MSTEFYEVYFKQNQQRIKRILSLKLKQTKSISRISTKITERMGVWYDNLVIGHK